MSETATDVQLKGAEWLVKPANPTEVFSPEDYNEEQKMVLEMCKQFLQAEVWPVLDRVDKLEPGLVPSLLDKAGELGLLSIAIPEQYGGMGKPFSDGMIVADALGGGFSFSVAVSAHTGIGTLPILYFGTEEQKQKYIPKLASGEWKASYGLTEPNAGSDALSAKTTAVLNAEGTHYLLNGQKAWITNGGFADVFTVFAKIDGKEFTAFILEKGMEGFTVGPEEHKMGIKGSSTVQLYFQDAKVPKENILGEIGKGHVIAFNILNIGRLKLAGAAIGGSKAAADISIKYANTREQFKQPIANFGAIQQKIADMAIRIWSTETAMLRASRQIEDWEHRLLEEGKPFNEAVLAAAEEFAVECAILKIHGSETLDMVVDEGVQIHGGNGFSDEYLISRAYRDSRINRIFEGTNEINRLLIVDMVLKRAMKGRLDLMGAAMSVQKELMAIPDFGSGEELPFEAEHKAIANIKKCVLMVAGAAAQKLMTKLEHEQELLMDIADMAMEAYICESILMRVQKQTEKAGADDAWAKYMNDMLQVYITDAMDRVNKSGKDAINSFASGDEQRMMLLGLKRFTKYQPVNTKDARRRIAAKLIADNGYRL